MNMGLVLMPTWMKEQSDFASVEWLEGRDDLQQDVGFSLTLSHTKSSPCTRSCGGSEPWRFKDRRHLGAGSLQDGSGLSPWEGICTVVCVAEPHVGSGIQRWGEV